MFGIENMPILFQTLLDDWITENLQIKTDVNIFKVRATFNWGLGLNSTDMCAV